MLATIMHEQIYALAERLNVHPRYCGTVRPDNPGSGDWYVDENERSYYMYHADSGWHSIQSPEVSGAADKPPLGVPPRKIFEEHLAGQMNARRLDLARAIYEYLQAGKEPDPEWARELSDLLKIPALHNKETYKGVRE